MGNAYKITDQFGRYFMTFTVHQWVDVFIRKEYRDILLESIKFCQKEKGLLVYAWVIMPNYAHFIFSSTKVPLSDVVRDLKKFTAKKIYGAIQNNPKESRRNWMLWLFTKDDNIWFWEEGYHGEEIFTKDFFTSKMHYIHANPVRAGIVEKEEEYLYSSCGEYYGIRKSFLELTFY